MWPHCAISHHLLPYRQAACLFRRFLSFIKRLLNKSLNFFNKSTFNRSFGRVLEYAWLNARRRLEANPWVKQKPFSDPTILGCIYLSITLCRVNSYQGQNWVFHVALLAFLYTPNHILMGIFSTQCDHAYSFSSVHTKYYISIAKQSIFNICMKQ